MAIVFGKQGFTTLPFYSPKQVNIKGIPTEPMLAEVMLVVIVTTFLYICT